MGRLVIGGALLLVCGLLFIIRGLADGNGSQVALGVPGFLLGLGSLMFYILDQNDRLPK